MSYLTQIPHPTEFELGNVESVKGVKAWEFVKKLVLKIGREMLEE